MNSLRRIVSLVIAIVFVASLAAPRAQAADQLLFGQTQTYTAKMRADKKVVTNAKIIFTNSEDSEQKTTSFILPDGVKASALSVYQIIPPKKTDTCTTYESLQTWRTRTHQSTVSPDSDQYLQKQYDLDKQCTVPASSTYDQDYNFKTYAGSSYYYDNSSSDEKISFKKLDPIVHGSSYTIPLFLPVQSQKDGALLISYFGEGFMSEFAGTYKYHYQTLKVPDAIDSVSVAINLDPDLYSKDIRGKTAISSPGSATLSTAADSAKGQGQQSNNLMNLQNMIGSDGTVTRTGTHLIAGDTFSVSGSFADSPWKLYLNEIVISIAVLVAATIIWWLFSRRKRKQPTTTNGKPKTEKLSNVELANNFQLSLNKKVAITAALVGEAGIIATTGLIALLSSTTESSGYYSNTTSLFIPIYFLAYFYFLVVLPLFLTIRHGRKTIFAWATLQTIFAIITLIILYFLMSQSSSTNISPPYSQ